MGQKILGIEQQSAPKCSNRRVQNAHAPHAPICPKSSSALAVGPRYLESLEATFFEASRRTWILVHRPSGLQDEHYDPCRRPRSANRPAYRNKGLITDVIFPGLQAAVHLPNGTTTIDGSAPATFHARKRAHYARPGHVSFDESLQPHKEGDATSRATSRFHPYAMRFKTLSTPPLSVAAFAFTAGRSLNPNIKRCVGLKIVV